MDYLSYANSLWMWLACGLCVALVIFQSAMFVRKSLVAGKELGITALHIKLWATGGNRTRTPGPGAQSALRALARSGMKTGRIENVTPIPSDSTRRKRGLHGHHL